MFRISSTPSPMLPFMAPVVGTQILRNASAQQKSRKFRLQISTRLHVAFQDLDTPDPSDVE